MESNKIRLLYRLTKYSVDCHVAEQFYKKF